MHPADDFGQLVAAPPKLIRDLTEPRAGEWTSSLSAALEARRRRIEPDERRSIGLAACAVEGTAIARGLLRQVTTALRCGDQDYGLGLVDRADAALASLEDVALAALADVMAPDTAELAGVH